MQNRAVGSRDKSREYSPGGLNLDDLHSKVNSLKAKYGIAGKMNIENQSGFGNTGSLNTSNQGYYQENEGNEVGYVGGLSRQGSNLSGQSISQETLLQKFSEMKMRIKNENFTRPSNPPN